MDNKQKSSIEWQFEELFNSFERFFKGEWVFTKYISNNLNVINEAKRKHKAEIEKAFKKGMVSNKTFEDYYKETYDRTDN